MYACRGAGPLEHVPVQSGWRRRFRLDTAAVAGAGIQQHRVRDFAKPARLHDLGGFLEVLVEDEGQGLANTANLFVPFFTTKPHGTGIGLVLCRQIAEAHGGTLTAGEVGLPIQRDWKILPCGIYGRWEE